MIDMQPTGCDVPVGSVMELPPGAGEAGSRSFQSQDASGQITDQPKPMDNLSRGHPGQRVPMHKITTRDQQWQDIGSGMVSRTFKRVSRLRTTSPGGPCIDDVSHRKIWSLSTGKLIDECDIDTTADSKLNREMDQVDDIRVE